MVFDPDPASSSGNPNLPPTASSLDSTRKEVALDFLNGRGLLEGRYVDVRNRLECNDRYGTLSPDHVFSYPHSESSFQEVMTYYQGTALRRRLDEAGVMLPNSPLKLVAHCMRDDNAYYMRQLSTTGPATEYVCMGDSIETPGASYADDAYVTLHEIQHGQTANHYSSFDDFGQFMYDEAGALSESLSDFVALMMEADNTLLDPRVFSRWALGLFVPGRSGARGAHRCPRYDPGYPDCPGYQNGPSGFSSDLGRVSYSYPDGMGFPMNTSHQGPGVMQGIFLGDPIQEEIHRTGIPIVGALWEAFDRVVANHQGNYDLVRGLFFVLIHRVLAAMPKPNALLAVSPVTFRGFAAKLVEWAPSLGWSTEDQADLVQALTDRGFVGGPKVEGSWVRVTPQSLVIQDSPATLKQWFGPVLSSVVTQNAGNLKLSRGDAAAIWFDLENLSQNTAGGVRLRVKITQGDVDFLSWNFNYGLVSAKEAEIMYSKVNGALIVSSLQSSNTLLNVPATTFYSGTNRYFATGPGGSAPYTALYIKVQNSAPSGQIVHFDVTVTPSNGDATVVSLEVPID